MRFALFPLLTLILAVSTAQAQSILENLPSAVSGEYPAEEAVPNKETPPPPPAAPVADPYTVADVNADVTADTAAHARDQALMQAERTAYTQLCGRLNVVDNGAKLNDDTLAALVQSFEVQSERLSSVRYIGVFTIRFKAAAVQKKIGKSLDVNGTPPIGGEGKSLPPGPVSHLTAAVQTDSLAAWTQIKKRLNAVPQVAKVDTLDLGRGVSHVDLSYAGSLDDLKQAVTAQGFVLRQAAGGGWELYDGSMISR